MRPSFFYQLFAVIVFGDKGGVVVNSNAVGHALTDNARGFVRAVEKHAELDAGRTSVKDENCITHMITPLLFRFWRRVERGGRVLSSRQ